MKIIKAIVYGNSWIALGAVASTWLIEGLGVCTVETPMLILLFAATFFRYNLIGFTVSAKVSSEKFQFAWQYRQWLKAGAVLGAIASIACLYWLNYWQIAALIHLGVISLWYIFPLPFKIAPALRKLPYIKIFLIAYVWACSTWVLPYIGFSMDFGATFYLGFAERFLFIFAITLPFDIRDIDVDGDTGVRTIPNKWGMRLSKNIGLVSLLVCAGISYSLYSTQHWLVLCLSYAIAYLLLEKSSPKRHDLYFLGAVDGVLVLQAILVMVTEQIQ